AAAAAEVDPGPGGRGERDKLERVGDVAGPEMRQGGRRDQVGLGLPLPKEVEIEVEPSLGFTRNGRELQGLGLVGFARRKVLSTPRLQSLFHVKRPLRRWPWSCAPRGGDRRPECRARLASYRRSGRPAPPSRAAWRRAWRGPRWKDPAPARNRCRPEPAPRLDGRRRHRRSGA